MSVGEKYIPPYPLGAADFLLSFEQLETMRWLPYLRRGGTIIYHTRSLALPVLCKQMSYPAHIPEQLDALEVQVIPVTENTGGKAGS